MARIEIMKYKMLPIIIILLVLITACQHNATPIADAGKNIEISFGDTVRLDASDSSDKDGDQLDFQWIFSIVPKGSSPFLDDSNSAFASFLPDIPGVYILELIVFDGESYSTRDHVVIDVVIKDGFIEPSNPNPAVKPPISPPPPPFFPPNGGPNPTTPPIGSIPTPLPPSHIPLPVPCHPTVLCSPIPHEIPAPVLPAYVGIVSEPLEIRSNFEFPIEILATHGWEFVSAPENADVEIIFDENGSFTFSTNVTGGYTLREIIRIDEQEVAIDFIPIQIVEQIVKIRANPLAAINTPVNLKLSYYSVVPPQSPSVSWKLINKPESSESKLDTENDFSFDTRFIPDVIGDYEVSVTVIVSTDEKDNESEPVIHTDSITIRVVDELDTDFDHAGLLDDSFCSDCHNGTVATGLSINHIRSTKTCGSCHSSFSWAPVAFLDHNEVIGACNDCHNGVIAIGKNANHPKTTTECAECHRLETWGPDLLPPKEPLPPILEPVPAEILPTIEIQIKTSSQTYKIEEMISARALLTNNGESDLTLFKMSSGAAPLMIAVSGKGLPNFILSNPNDPEFDTPAIQTFILKAGETINREVIWNQMLPLGGLAPAGDYIVRAFVILLDPVSKQQIEQGFTTEITIEHPVDIIQEETALLTALKEPEVQTWYEANGKNITCGLSDQIALINDYLITPIQTLVPVPDSEINCRTELSRAPNALWHIFFRGSKPDDDFSYHVIIDAISKEVKLSEAN